VSAKVLRALMTKACLDYYAQACYMNIDACVAVRPLGVHYVQQLHQRCQLFITSHSREPRNRR
jgi:hypothetical protein